MLPRRPAGYILALLVGVGLALSVFPGWAWSGGLPPGAPPRADFGKDVLGQLYFFSQSWSLTTPAGVLIDRRLNQPWGASIALTDSMPLLTILAKLLRPVLPSFDQTISIYQAAAWILQPVAAVFALRGAGERRWLPGLAIAILAASMPIFLHRLWQSALSGHFWLLIMLGLYLRITRGRLPPLLCGCLLQIALLLIHPYLMLMATALLLAAPLTLLLRRDRRWRPVLVAISISSGGVVLLGQVLGYWSSGSDGGFGYYSLNLAAPFWPALSGLFPGIAFAPVDATGGQADGYGYLGAGMLLLLAVSLSGWRRWRLAIRRHPGLALACVALTLLAVTNWVFVMHHLVVHIPFPSLLLSQVRASGRCFWPVAYVLLVGCVLITIRAFPRIGAILLLAAALVQFSDAAALRDLDRSSLADTTPYPFDQRRVSAILRRHTRLAVVPTFPCNGGGTPTNLDLLWLAGQTRMATNGMYMARETHEQACVPAAVTDARPEPDEVRVVLPGHEQAVTALPDHARDCRVLAPFVICTRDAAGLEGLAAYPVRPVPLSVALPVRAGLPGANLLIAGWTPPTVAGGSWSSGMSVMLGAPAEPSSDGAVRLRVWALATPARSWLGRSETPRLVSVWAGRRHLADWSMGPSLSQYEAVVPADAIRRAGAVMVELRTGPLTSRLDQGLSTDPRPFGLYLDKVSLSLATPSGTR